MNIHEYQAKELLAKFGVAIPKGIAAMSVEEAVAAAKQLPGPLYVVKSQIHAGGRGKAGGVKVVKSTADVATAAAGMLGQRLKTKQTSAEGLPINGEAWQVMRLSRNRYWAHPDMIALVKRVAERVWK